MPRQLCLLISLCLGLHLSVVLAAPDTESIPPVLQPWIPWVLHQQAECVWRYDELINSRSDPSEQSHFCQWPGQLVLHVSNDGAQFTQYWQITASGWVVLPGDSRHWPQSVQVNGIPAPVADRDGIPSLWLTAGDYHLSGVFGWRKPPDALAISPQSGLLQLYRDDNLVSQPELDERGQLWLRDRQEIQEAEAENDRLELRVFRRINDDIPLQVITRLELDVAGRPREVLLGPLLLAEHLPMTLDSPLPARLEADGRLRLQVRPGTWEINLLSRQHGPVESLTLPAADAPWPTQEVWVFDARNDLRLVEIAGVTAIDPQQTSLPQLWRSLPAYLLEANDTLKFIVRRRGDPEPMPNQLQLQRNFWLDFDGRGYTVQDSIEGSMTQGWRLEMQPPATLGRASVNEQDQLITHLADSERAGVEVRRGEIALLAESRLDEALNILPITGWAHDFQRVSASLHLPPGWQLLHLRGTDRVSYTWLQQWTLLGVFTVLILSMAIGRLWHWGWGVFTLLTMALVYPSLWKVAWLMLIILAMVALLRVLPAISRIAWLLRQLRNLALLWLIIMIIPFSVNHLQRSLYPQLEQPQRQLSAPEKVYEVQSEARPNKKDITLSEDEIMQVVEENALLSTSRYERSASAKPQAIVISPNMLVQIDPKALVQTGPGLPQWDWQHITLNWNGPVQSQETIQLYLLPPVVTRLLGFVQVILLGLLTLLLLVGSAGRGLSVRLQEWRQPVAVLCLLPVLMLLSQTLPAMETQAELAVVEPSVMTALPEPDMLEELRHRLLEPPDCLPYCASNPQLNIDLTADFLRLHLALHTLSEVAVPLPGHSAQWLPQRVWLDGEDTTALLRENGSLWLRLSPGIHQVVMEGPLPLRQRIQLALPLPPRQVDVKADGWQIEGLHGDGLADQQLQLNRLHDENTALSTLDSGSLPPFVLVERTLQLGLDWQVTTQVRRISPDNAAIVLEVPLLDGESVTSERVRVENGHAFVNLPPGQASLQWNSLLDKQASLTLTAPDSRHSMDIWRIDITAIWHVKIDGIPPVQHQRDGRWLPEWRPWAGESVTLHLTRPAGVDGQILTLDNSLLQVRPGQRSTDYTLNIQLRSSRGGQHILTLPDDSHLQSVSINGQEQPIRLEGTKLTLPVTPGTQQVVLQFQRAEGITQKFVTPPLDLGTPSVNAHVEVVLPADRWILFTAGDAIGPAVLIWGQLIAVALIAIILGQLHITPLKTYEWLLLGLALSQLYIGGAILVVIWLLALGWRAQRVDSLSNLQFNFIQLGLIGLSFIALFTLVAAIEQGLLGSPEMHISGNNSSEYVLRWYQDRIDNTLPVVQVYSLPVMVYRLFMLLWALWLSFAMLRWLRWGWGCFSHHGVWRRMFRRRGLTG